MNRVTVKVKSEILKETIGMDDYARKYYLIEHGCIPDSHLYGYGIYSGMSYVDDCHVSYKIGSSCD